MKTNISIQKINENIKKALNNAFNFLASDYGTLIILLIAALCIIFGLGDAGTSTLAFALITSPNGDTFISDEPLTTSITRENTPSLLRNEIDDRIVKIRPMATPIDQISRCGGARHCGSMIVDYYSVDTKPISASLVSKHDMSRNGSGQNPSATLFVDNVAIFEPSETILVPDVNGTDVNDKPTNAVVLYVLSRNIDDDSITVIAVNGYDDKVSGKTLVPDLPENTKLIRMGRAAAELDVQTAQFEALPVKKQNFCQVFKTQVEQSTFQKIANKEVGWSFSDQEESAIIDMRLGMEKNFLFGKMARINDSHKNSEVFLTGGVWNQTDRVFKYTKGNLTQNNVVEMTRVAFTENAGSARKILIGGTGLIEELNKLDFTKVINSGDKVTHWGIDFDQLQSKFGTLYVLHSEIFDQCGHFNDGFIIDPNFIQKYTHVPFRADRLDLKKSGIRNTDAVVVTEASCLVLRYPSAHVKVIAQNPINNPIKA